MSMVVWNNGSHKFCSAVRRSNIFETYELPVIRDKPWVTSFSKV